MSWVQKKTYYNDRDYRKNAFLKNKNVKIKRPLTFSWHGRHLGLPWLNAGSCHRPPQTNLEFHGFHTFIIIMHKNSEKKKPRRKAILRGKFQQPERQHNTQKSLLLPSFLPGGGTQQTSIREGSAPKFNLVPFYIVGFHITSLKVKLRNYRSYWDFTLMVY